MSEAALETSNRKYIAVAGVTVGLVFLFAPVLAKLLRDWWTDENYSHGLLIPFVIGFIIWNERRRFSEAISQPALIAGGITLAAGSFLLIVGTVGAELFTQRIALVIALLGSAIYFFGRKLLPLLAVPAALLLLAIPIPQIAFNKIAFPLQIWASQLAVWAIRLADVPTLRKGNVIDILPYGSTQTISLEVVEACSGIRSLMTLITLALLLSFFTRCDTGRILRFGLLSGGDLVRAVLLMAAAIPIAVLTNAGRVAATGYFTFHYGKQATEGFWHDLSGWLVYVVALVLLLTTNFLLRRILKPSNRKSPADPIQTIRPWRLAPLAPVLVLLITAGAVVNWFATRSELAPERRQLSALSTTLGDWRQRGGEIRFDESVETVLNTSDYTMREYTREDGRLANVYVGYYQSQRMGATYHSPRNCLPGAGWVMSEPSVQNRMEQHSQRIATSFKTVSTRKS
jgi:exosortase D (VPLPA-CTERM-specific)